jgi:hypothetical protein
LRNAALSVLLLLFLFAGSPPTGSRPTSVLGGLERLYVHISYLSEMATEVGVDEQDLVSEVSLNLSRAGLVVLSAESYRPDTPFVSITLDTVVLPSGDMAYHLSFELQEDVFLARDKYIVTSGSTWYSSRFGISDDTALPDDCLMSVDSLVDEFLAEWAGTTP